MYAKRHGPFKYELAYNYLKDKPKWSIFCEENKDVEKSARPPKGVKAAKRAEAYSKHVNRALDNLVGPPGNTQPINLDGASTGGQQPTPGVGAWFKETNDTIQQLVYAISIGQMSPELKMQAKRMRDLEYRERLLEVEERECKVAMLRRLDDEVSVAQEVPREAAMPQSANGDSYNNNVDNDSDDDSLYGDQVVPYKSI